jgi:hypothetical protein
MTPIELPLELLFRVVDKAMLVLPLTHFLRMRLVSSKLYVHGQKSTLLIAISSF